MSTKLFIGGLGQQTTTTSLQRLFEPFGAVEHVALEKLDGTDATKGTIHMSSSESAMKAIMGLRGKDFEGRRIAVYQQKPKDRAPY